MSSGQTIVKLFLLHVLVGVVRLKMSMKKVLLLTVFVLFGILFSVRADNAYAQVCSVSPNTIDITKATNQITTTLGTAYDLNTIKDVEIDCCPPGEVCIGTGIYIPKNQLSLGSNNKTITAALKSSDLHELRPVDIENIRDNANNNSCQLYVHLNDGSTICHAQNISLSISSCGISVSPNNVIQAAKPYTVSVTNIPSAAQNVNLYVQKTTGPTGGGQIIKGAITPPSVTAESTITHNVDTQLSIYVTGKIFNTNFGDWGYAICEQHYKVGQAISNDPGTNNPTDPNNPNGGTALISTDICTFAGPVDSQPFNDCKSCVNNQKGIWTAIGCIPANPQDFVARLLKLAIGIAGGIAFLMIIYGGFQIMMSSGNPEKLNSGKEVVTSAIAGLLLIVFSVVILKIIGVDVLGIPGLTK